MARAALLLGDTWTLLILREAIHGVNRFDQFHRDLDIPRAVLSKRLKTLVEEEVFEKIPTKQVGQRSYNSYVFTKKGSRLIPTLIALGQWGKEFTDGPPSRLNFRHTGCGGFVTSQLVCECGECGIKLDFLELSISS